MFLNGYIYDTIYVAVNNNELFHYGKEFLVKQSTYFKSKMLEKVQKETLNIIISNSISCHVPFDTDQDLKCFL